ncbi:hypothetical protein HJ197_21760, partial [Vibrio parahaemolyticus]|nr:hypothetical protein [Vibrio parahaemolyticus]
MLIILMGFLRYFKFSYGANIKAGTIDSLVRGGIAFSTPEQSQIPPAAKRGHSFYL